MIPDFEEERRKHVLVTIKLPADMSTFGAIAKALSDLPGCADVRAVGAGDGMVISIPVAPFHPDTEEEEPTVRLTHYASCESLLKKGPCNCDEIGEFDTPAEEYEASGKTGPCDNYAPDAAAPDPEDRHICTTCLHAGIDHKQDPHYATVRWSGEHFTLTTMVEEDPDRWGDDDEATIQRARQHLIDQEGIDPTVFRIMDVEVD